MENLQIQVGVMETIILLKNPSKKVVKPGPVANEFQNLTSFSPGRCLAVREVKLLFS